MNGNGNGNVNVKRESSVKVLGRWVRVPNWLVFERKRWSPERIAREELRAQQLGDMQKIVMASPLFPWACAALFFAALMFVTWAVPMAVDTLL